MNVDVTVPAELGESELQTWRRIQEGSEGQGSPFLSPQFSLACGQVRPNTRIAVFTTDDAVRGFFAFEAGRSGVGRAVGTGCSDVQGIVAPESADLRIRALLTRCGLRLWEFDHLLERQAGWFAGAPHRWVAEASPAIDLRSGWAAYDRAQRRVSSSLLSTTARKRRKLEREHGPVSLTFHVPDHRILDQLMAWKSAQYRRSGWRDVFADPGMRRLVHDLLDAYSPEFGAPLTVLRAGDEVVAAHLGLRSASTLAWWYPVYAPAFSSYSPGLVLCLDLLRALPGEDLQLLDLGKGDEPYKARLANSETRVLRGAVSPSLLASRLDTARRWPREVVRQSPTLRTAARRTRVRVARGRAWWADRSNASPRA